MHPISKTGSHRLKIREQRRHWFTLFVFFLAFSLPWFSPALPATPLNIQEHQLPNGLKIITLEDHKAPVVTFQIWYRVGSRNEITGKTGLAHLNEHMMFKGTSKYGKGEFSKIVAKNGGNENAFTSQDYTGYFEIFSSDRLDLSLELESDRMVNLLVDPKEFLLERDVVKEERRLRTEDDPVSSLVEELYADAFKVHPYHNPVIGWMTDLDRLTREDLYQHYKRYYTPNNAIIVVVGDFDTQTLLKKIEASFGKIPPGPPIPPVQIEEPEPQGEHLFYLKKEAQLPYVIYGYHATNYKDPDQYPLDLLANILSSGKSSRLYQSLIYEKKLALDAGGGYEAIQSDPELFYFYAEVQPGKAVEDVKKALDAEIEKIKQEPVSPTELEKAKNQVEAGFIFGQDSVFNRAMMIGRMETTGAGYHYIEEYLPHIRSVTAEDIQRVARKYFSEDGRTVGVLIPLPPKE
jgi:zinc protease